MTDFNNDFSTDLADSLLAGIGVGLALAFEHVALWPLVEHLDPNDEIWPLLPYIIGTATIGAGMTGLAIRWRDPRQAVAFWTLAGSGGVVVGGLRLYRKWLRVRAEFYKNKGQGAGQVAGVKEYRLEYQKRSEAARIA